MTREPTHDAATHGAVTHGAATDGPATHDTVTHDAATHGASTSLQERTDVPTASARLGAAPEISNDVPWHAAHDVTHDVTKGVTHDAASAEQFKQRAVDGRAAAELYAVVALALLALSFVCLVCAVLARCRRYLPPSSDEAEMDGAEMDGMALRRRRSHMRSQVRPQRTRPASAVRYVRVNMFAGDLD